ncbi:hypothetical protein PRZ48_005511 [Zasmidium cellare]|uniref:Uncharacterized protein n=1 Tax=Zasmidium cellare TaxID=395010 RepID=A0ABR0ETK9_ZASCE|nr:hypothetical protein PRZ48_005511 [Zasmidium cellare]
MLSWASSSSAGYTKKLMRNVFFIVGYGVSNIILPQIWVAADAPSWIGTPLTLLTVRFILKRLNAQRKAWIAEQEALGHDGHGYVERLDENSQVVKTQVDVSLLDLTDLENKYFLYPV